MTTHHAMNRDFHQDHMVDDLLEDTSENVAAGKKGITGQPGNTVPRKPAGRKKLLYSKKGDATPGPRQDHDDPLFEAGEAGNEDQGLHRSHRDIPGGLSDSGDPVLKNGATGPGKTNQIQPADLSDSGDHIPKNGAPGPGKTDQAHTGPAGMTAAASPGGQLFTDDDDLLLDDGPLLQSGTAGPAVTAVTPVSPPESLPRIKRTLKPSRSKRDRSPGDGMPDKDVSPARKSHNGQSLPVSPTPIEDDIPGEDAQVTAVVPRGLAGKFRKKKTAAMSIPVSPTLMEDAILEEDAPVPAVVPGGLAAKFRRKKTAVISTPAPTPANGNGSGLLSTLAGIFAKKVKREMQTIPFHVGPLDEPSLQGALRDVNVTYPVNPPFQYVHIEYDRDDGVLRYEVREPELSDDEKFALTIVEQGFEKMISTNLDLIVGGDRVEYLKERYLSVINIFGINATEEQKERMFFHLCKKYLGFSHMDTLMKDKYIEDISCNGSGINLYVMHRIYGSVQTNVKFEEIELNNFVLRLAQVAGRHISLLQPIRDVTLPDGSRGNLTLGSEVTKKGSTFTIRKFRTNPISPIEMMEYGTIDAQQLAYLWILMEYKRSILVSGGTATGKTTMLNVLCTFIPSEYKIVSIEDTAELNLLSPNWIQSVTRTGFGGGEAASSNAQGSGGSRKSPGDIALYDLLVAALRQRPEFIIVGEVRGDEAFTLFQAIAVGHAALGTIHAGSINELMARIESNPMNVPRSLFSNLDAVIFPMHIMQGERSARRVANIVEVLELDRDTGDLITNTSFKWIPDQDVFKFHGRTFLFDKIRDTYGISKEKLKEEMDNRIRFLEWLRNKGVRDYYMVVRLLRQYQRNKEVVLERIRDNGEVGDLLEAEETLPLPQGFSQGGPESAELLEE